MLELFIEFTSVLEPTSKCSFSKNYPIHKVFLLKSSIKKDISLKYPQVLI